MISETVRITGYLVQAFSICHRQVWFLAHGMTADQKNETLSLGRLIDQNSYARERHQVDFGDGKFDFVQEKDGRLVVCEVKKSSRSEASARLQLAHYLHTMKKVGVDATGVLLFPAEKRRVEMELTPDLTAELEKAYEEIDRLTRLETPPPLVRCRHCSGCAFAEYCWG